MLLLLFPRSNEITFTIMGKLCSCSCHVSMVINDRGAAGKYVLLLLFIWFNEAAISIMIYDL